MDTRFIEVRKNITVRLIPVATSSLTYEIHIDFIPDEVIIKYVIYNTIQDEAGVTLIYTDLVSDVIGSFMANMVMTPNITFTLRKPINGIYTFNLLSLDNPPQFDNQRNGQITIHLEFVKYRTGLPDFKVY